MKQALMIMMLFRQSSYVYDFFVSHYPYLDNNNKDDNGDMFMGDTVWYG